MHCLSLNNALFCYSSDDMQELACSLLTLHVAAMHLCTKTNWDAPAMDTLFNDSIIIDEVVVMGNTHVTSRYH